MSRNEKLDRALRKNLLFTGVANELNGSFGVLHTGAELLAQQLERCPDGPETEKLRQTVRTMQNSLYRVERLSGYLNEILQGCTDSLKPCRVAIDMSARLRVTADLVQEECQKRRWTATFSLRLPKEAVWAVGDEGYVAQILGILLTNALRMEQADVKVELALGEGHTLRVADNGPPIPPQAIAAILKDDFAQELDDSVCLVGMTLYLARLYCEAMGWKMQIESGVERTVVQIEMLPGKPDENKPLTMRSRVDDPVERRLRSVLHSNFNAAFGVADR